MNDDKQYFTSGTHAWGFVPLEYDDFGIDYVDS